MGLGTVGSLTILVLQIFY